MDTNTVITYPLKERRDRLLIGGILYTTLGLALVFVGLFFGQGIFTFAGVILTIAGLGVLGFRRESQFDSAQQSISLIRGWFVFLAHTDLPFSSVVSVLIQKRVTAGSRFSKMDDRQYEETINVSYRVMLETNEGTHYVVDSTSVQADARQWAKTLCECLDVSLKETDEELAPTNEWKDKLIRGIKIVAGLALAAGMLVLAVTLLF